MANVKVWSFVVAALASAPAALAQPAAGAGEPAGASPPAEATKTETGTTTAGVPAASAPAAAPGPAPAEVPSPAQTSPGAAPASAPSPEAPPAAPVAPSAPSQTAAQRPGAVPEPPAEDPSTLRATTAVDAGVAAADPGRVRFALELGAGFSGGGRFPSDTLPRSNQEAIDGAYGLGAFVGNRSALYGLAVEISGLGRDHFGSANGATTINASYRVDTLWLQGRWYFSERRPAFYVSGAVGPALPVANATGTRPSNEPLVAPPVPFQCTETGKVGLGLSAGAGAEFDVARDWSLLGDARLVGHVLSRDSAEFGACAPATGSALAGTVRVGVQLRL